MRECGDEAHPEEYPNGVSIGDMWLALLLVFAFFLLLRTI
jgi:hypothetical protein